MESRHTSERANKRNTSAKIQTEYTHAHAHTILTHFGIIYLNKYRDSRANYDQASKRTSTFREEKTENVPTVKCYSSIETQIGREKSSEQWQNRSRKRRVSQPSGPGGKRDRSAKRKNNVRERKSVNIIFTHTSAHVVRVALRTKFLDEIV